MVLRHADGHWVRCLVAGMPLHDPLDRHRCHVLLTPPRARSFVFSRQRRDESIARGAEQRSAVLVSRFPYSSLLRPLAALAGASLLSYFAAVAPQLLHDSTHAWPAIRPGRLLRVAVGSQCITAAIPADSCLPDVPPADSAAAEASASLSRQVSTRASLPGLRRTESVPMPNPASPDSALARATSASLSLSGELSEAVARSILGAFCDVDVAEPFQGQLKSLWPLWEVVLLGKPLLVFAAAPWECCAGVVALLALLTPLPFAADFRPVLSIHDPLVQQIVVRTPFCCEQFVLAHTLC
jgi:hypothetical protein